MGATMSEKQARGSALKLETGIYILESKKENRVIQRIEALIRIEHMGRSTPSREEIAGAVSKILGVDKSLVVIRRVETEYGRSASKAWIHIYRDRATLEKFEPKHLLERGIKKGEKGGGE